MPAIDAVLLLDQFSVYGVVPYVSKAQREDERDVPLWKAAFTTYRGDTKWLTVTVEQDGWVWLDTEARRQRLR